MFVEVGRLGFWGMRWEREEPLQGTFDEFDSHILHDRARTVRQLQVRCSVGAEAWDLYGDRKGHLTKAG